MAYCYKQNIDINCELQFLPLNDTSELLLYVIGNC